MASGLGAVEQESGYGTQFDSLGWTGRKGSLSVACSIAYPTLKPEQSNIFFKLTEERYHRHASIIITNLSYDEWGNFLGNPAMVDALLSRVRHYCHTIRIDGPSLRDPQG